MKMLLLVLMLSAVSGHKLCDINPAATVGPGDPRLPQALPPSFSVTVEAAFLNRGLSVSAREYFDQTSGRSSLGIRQSGHLESIYVNYNTNETYHIVGENCTVHNQAGDIDDAFIGGHAGGHGLPHSYSTAAALRFAQKYGEVYAGMKNIRGIPVDHWQSCMYWDFLGVNFTLDYYFSASNWSTADGLFQIPVRAEVQGYMNDLGPIPGSSFHHIYDYVDFKAGIDDPTALETPKGVVCPGRRHTRAMPQLKQQYQYREEITADMTVINIDVWYDYSYKLLRYDYRPSAMEDPYYSLDAITEIHDFNTGVAYVIDKTYWNCSIVPIEKTTWDATATHQHIAMSMKNPENMFYLDPTFAYSGQRTVRGIPCDVFSTIKTDFPSFPNMNTLFEVYFMDKGWISDNDIGADTQSVDIPVRMEISEPTNAYYAKYDFFDFDQEHPFLSSFDITRCYTDQNEIRLEIQFPGDHSMFLEGYQNLLEEFSVLEVAQATLVSPLRVQHLDIHWDKNNTYLLATLLNVSPPLARYRRWPKLVASYSDDKVLNLTDPSLCATACSVQQNAVCNSFDFCPGAGTCALSLNYTSDGKVLQSSDTCDHFSRVMTDKPVMEVGVEEAYNILKEIVNMGKFSYNIIVPLLGVNESFTASSIRRMSYAPPTTSGSKLPNYSKGSTKLAPNPNTTPTSGKGQTGKGQTGKTQIGSTKASTRTKTSSSSPISKTSKPKPPTPKPLCSKPETITSNHAGVIVGVALAMLALGLILGGAAMVFYQKRQQKTPYDISSVQNPAFSG